MRLHSVSCVGLLVSHQDAYFRQLISATYRNRPKFDPVGPDGLEPSTHGLKVRCSTD